VFPKPQDCTVLLSDSALLFFAEEPSHFHLLFLLLMADPFLSAKAQMLVKAAKNNILYINIAEIL